MVEFCPPPALRNDIIEWTFSSDQCDSFWQLASKYETPSYLSREPECGICQDAFGNPPEGARDSDSSDSKVTKVRIIHTNKMVRLMSCPSDCKRSHVICTRCVKGCVKAGMENCPFCQLPATPLQFRCVYGNKPFEPKQSNHAAKRKTGQEYEKNLGEDQAAIQRDQGMADLIRIVEAGGTLPDNPL